MKVERLKKAELDQYCKILGIETKGKNKTDLIADVYNHHRAEIDKAIKSGNSLDLLKLKISNLADEYANNLREKIDTRREEMKAGKNDGRKHRGIDPKNI